MKSILKTHTGELLALGSMLPWAFFPIVGKLVFDALHPLFFVGVTTFIAGVVFAVIVTFQKKWHEAKVPAVWGSILMSTFLVGIMFHGLLFWGLQYTSAGNAGIFSLLEIFFSFVFFGLFIREKQKILHIWGAIFIVFGASMVLFQNGITSFSWGDIIIIVATMMPPIGNYFQQKAVKKISTSFLLCIRSIISGIFLLLLSLWGDLFPTEVSEFSWSIIVLTGIGIFSISKICIVGSYRYISVSRAISLEASAPIFTLILSYYILGEIPTLWQISGFFPILVGVFLLMRK